MNKHNTTTAVNLPSVQHKRFASEMKGKLPIKGAVLSTHLSKSIHTSPRMNTEQEQEENKDEAANQALLPKSLEVAIEE